MKGAQIISGEKVGKSTILRSDRKVKENRPGKGRSRGRLWAVQCECGNAFSITTAEVNRAKREQLELCFRCREGAQ